MGADDDVGCPVFQARPRGLLICRGHGTGQQVDDHPGAVEIADEAVVVLLSENRGGGDERALGAGVYDLQDRAGGHGGLAAAHVSQQQGVHGRGLGQGLTDSLAGLTLPGG